MVVLLSVVWMCLGVSLVGNAVSVCLCMSLELILLGLITSKRVVGNFMQRIHTQSTVKQLASSFN